ncbi:MAG: low molecular weight phosphotyrosine protein phosphatase [Ruminococcaceae bacterium]|nr:low molecular weight phosphotyrosine protein phosphatase [Oscillospiraceae bacterium]
MKRIMFVCHGNICRSPMAEFIMKDLVEKRGLSEEFEINSCATSTEEIGNDIYPPARAELQRRGIKTEKRRAVQLKKEDYDRYDLIICMEDYNLRNIKRIIREDPLSKIKKLLDYKNGGDVADPWYSGRFDIAYRDILSGCEALLEELMS